MTSNNFAGKVVLVTGAAGGLGVALCKEFSAAGARIVAMDLDSEKLSLLQQELPQGALCIGGPDVGDITQLRSCERAVQQTLARFGALDVLVNNAGISHRSLLAETNPRIIRRVMEVNFLGSVQLTHAALAPLIASRGSVVAISSVAGFAPLYGRTGYAASKHALHGFFTSLRTEVAPHGVSVTLVCPSFISTGIAESALGGQGTAPTATRIAAGGESSPDDIAQRIVRAVSKRQPLLLPDRTSRLAWWAQKLLPGFYARTMTRRVRGEFDPIPQEKAVP